MKTKKVVLKNIYDIRCNRLEKKLSYNSSNGINYLVFNLATEEYIFQSAIYSP